VGDDTTRVLAVVYAGLGLISRGALAALADDLGRLLAAHAGARSVETRVLAAAD
jgi:hypothetical protein